MGWADSTYQYSFTSTKFSLTVSVSTSSMMVLHRNIFRRYASCTALPTTTSFFLPLGFGTCVCTARHMQARLKRLGAALTECAVPARTCHILVPSASTCWSYELRSGPASLRPRPHKYCLLPG
eukprot:2242541-Pyramimonas_sp.AAC.1